MIFENIEGVQALQADEAFKDCCIETCAREVYDQGMAYDCISCGNTFRVQSLTEVGDEHELTRQVTMKSAFEVDAVVVHGAVDSTDINPASGDADEVEYTLQDDEGASYVDGVLKACGLTRGGKPAVLSDDITGEGHPDILVWKNNPVKQSDQLLATVTEGVSLLGRVVSVEESYD